MQRRTSRRALIVGMGALAGLAQLPAAASAAPARPGPAPAPGSGRAALRARDAGRAIASYQALQRHFRVDDGSGLYRERYPVGAGDNAYSYEWPYSQVHGATVDLSGLPGGAGARFTPDLAARQVGQQRYWYAAGGTTGLPGYASYPVAPYGGGGDFFYDDNEWVGLLDVQRYLMSGDRAALGRARTVFELVRSGWDTDPTHPDPGGVFWTQATWSNDRNTVSNMPGAQLGLRLYQITRDRSYLDWSLRMYEWTNRYMLGPDGLYWDHVDLAGTVEKTFWTYNQGVPVAVNVLLYQVTRQRDYLSRAERIADASYEYYVTRGRLADQPPFFNSIYFKNLLLLESITGGHRWIDTMRDYGDLVWDTRRDPGTGLFVFGTEAQTEVIQQAAMVQIYAVLGWKAEQYPVLY